MMPNQASAAPPKIDVHALVNRLILRVPVTFRPGNTPGYVEVVSFAGQVVELVRADVARTAVDYWLTQRINIVLCQRN